jgi:hypothetical protein
LERRVKGTLFVDYVRMLRANKDADWSRYLQPADLAFLGQRIDPDGWYPMESFERMGVAILAEVARGELDLVREFGRMQAEVIGQSQPDLVAPGNPTESLMRFQVMRNSFFDYQAVEIAYVYDGEAALEVRYGMGPVAEEAASLQTMGFFEKLLELAGAQGVSARFSAESWKGAPVTTVELRWTAS